MEKESDKEAPVHLASAQVVPEEPLEEPSLSFSDSEEDALIADPLPEPLPKPQYFQISNELLKTEMNEEELNKPIGPKVFDDLPGEFLPVLFDAVSIYTANILVNYIHLHHLKKEM